MSEEGKENTLGGGGENPPPPETLGEKDWRTGLPEEFRDHDYVRKYESIDGFVKDAVNAQGLIGRTGIRKPDENSTIEDWANFYGELGRPESPDGYALEEVAKEWSSDMPRNLDAEVRITQDMYDMGLNKSQAQKMWKAYGDVQNATAAAQIEELKTTLAEFTATLTRDWGADAFDQELQLAQYAFREIFGDLAEGFGQMTDSNGVPLGAHPDVVKKFAGMGKLMREDHLEGNKGSAQFAVTREGAHQQINALKSDSEFQERLHNANHAGHEQAVAERDRLYRIAYPDEAA